MCTSRRRGGRILSLTLIGQDMARMKKLTSAGTGGQLVLGLIVMREC